MNYIEKVKYLIEREEKGDYDKEKYDPDVRFRKNKWKENELEEIIKEYDFVPESYVRFVKEFDNIGLTFCVFYGSKAQGLALAEEIEEFKEYYDNTENYFPFAKDADGSTFAFNQNQEVMHLYIKDYEIKEPKKIADTFDEFMNDCLMGKKYIKLVEDDDTYAYFKHLGWA
jgi:hypothetical protein